MRLALGLGLPPGTAGDFSGAGILAGTEPDVLALDGTDLSTIVRDTTTPANNFNGNINNKLTYTAPSSKFIHIGGNVWEAGTTLRTEYSAAGVALGIRVEEARTNAALQASSLDNATWVKTGCTAVKTATGPNGTSNYASTVTATSANAFVRQVITAASAARISSGFIKRRTGSGVVGLSQGETTGSTLVTNGDFATNDLTGWTDVSVGAGTASGATGAAVLTQTNDSNRGQIDQQLTTVAGTVYVFTCSVAITTGTCDILIGTTQGAQNLAVSSGAATTRKLGFVATGTTVWVRLRSAGGGAANIAVDDVAVLAVVETSLSLTTDWQQLPTGSATITNPVLGLRLATSGDAVDVAWMQCEIGAFATSPIETTTGTVTRAADNITLLLSAIPWSATENTIYAEFFSARSTQNSSWRIDNASDTEIIYHTSSSTGTYQNVTGSAATCNMNAGSLNVGAMNKESFAVKADDFAACLNGGAVATDTSGAVASANVTTIKFGRGSSGASSQMGSWLKAFRIVPRRETNTEMQARTA